MKPFLKILGFLLLYKSLFILNGFSQGVAFELKNNYVEILYNNKRLMIYTYDTSQFKPYVKELYTLDGRNVLLDAPPDHLHHHGLMYAITVNGINFWEESKNPGIEFPVSMTGPETSTGATEGVKFTHTIHWVSQTNRAKATNQESALLIEKRTLKLSVDKKAREVHLDWTGDFTVPNNIDKVTLTGTDYHGLGIRFPRAFDKTARHFNQKNLPYPTAGKRDLIEAQWAAITTEFENKPLTIAVITHSTVKGRSVFFSMTDPFAYLSATQGINKEPMIYKGGDKFSVRYLIIVSEKELKPSEIEKRMVDWLKD